MADERTERVSFTSAQQVTVDKLIDRAFAKGLSRGTQMAKPEIERLKAELEQAKKPFWRR